MARPPWPIHRRIRPPSRTSRCSGCGRSTPRSASKAADTLIGEYRSWARQLVAAIGVVIGLEVTLLVRLALDGGSPLHASWRVLCLVVFFGMLGLQFWTLHRLLVVGYKSQPVVGPESPSVLANY